MNERTHTTQFATFCQIGIDTAVVIAAHQLLAGSHQFLDQQNQSVLETESALPLRDATQVLMSGATSAAATEKRKTAKAKTKNEKEQKQRGAPANAASASTTRKRRRKGAAGMTMTAVGNARGSGWHNNPAKGSASGKFAAFACDPISSGAAATGSASRPQALSAGQHVAALHARRVVDSSVAGNSLVDYSRMSAFPGLRKNANIGGSNMRAAAGVGRPLRQGFGSSVSNMPAVVASGPNAASRFGRQVGAGVSGRGDGHPQGNQRSNSGTRQPEVQGSGSGEVASGDNAARSTLRQVPAGRSKYFAPPACASAGSSAGSSAAASSSSVPRTLPEMMAAQRERSSHRNERKEQGFPGAANHTHRAGVGSRSPSHDQCASGAAKLAGNNGATRSTPATLYDLFLS
jgi:hypothetical protein